MSTVLRWAILRVKSVCNLKYSRQHKVEHKERSHVLTHYRSAILLMYFMSELVCLQRRRIVSDVLRMKIAYVLSGVQTFLKSNVFLCKPFHLCNYWALVLKFFKLWAPLFYGTPNLSFERFSKRKRFCGRLRSCCWNCSILLPLATACWSDEADTIYSFYVYFCTWYMLIMWSFSVSLMLLLAGCTG